MVAFGGARLAKGGREVLNTKDWMEGYASRSIFVVALVLLTLSIPGQAHGATGYTIRQLRGPVYSYAGDKVQGHQVDVLPPGAKINIRCQDFGQAIHGSNVWDQLSDGSWVSDYWTTTPVFNDLSPGFVRCSSMITYSSKPPRETLAFSFALYQVGAAWQPGGLPWAWWCDRFVANAYGMRNSGYNTAIDHYHDLAARGLIHTGDTNAPFGALVFYNTSGGGHVALSYGGGQIITTPAVTGQAVYKTTLSHFPSYLGWAYANPEWPGL